MGIANVVSLTVDAVGRTFEWRGAGEDLSGTVPVAGNVAARCGLTRFGAKPSSDARSNPG